MASVIVVASGDLEGHLRQVVEDLGHSVVIMRTVSSLPEQKEAPPADVALLEADLAARAWSSTIRATHELPGHPQVIVTDRSPNPDNAEQAIRGGAWEYTALPLQPHLVSALIDRVLTYRAGRPLEGPQAVASTSDGIVGRGAAMNLCREVLGQAARSDAHVLILGETGTGKELFARAIHAASARGTNNFVVVDCAAIPENLVESTLFGHERGSFTGAERSHIGLVQQADGGTLFLDEISEMPLGLQKSFLRVLQDKRFRRVGGQEEITSDFRIMAATNRDLDELIRSGRFRKDLLHRVRAFNLDLPPLRDHLEDLPEMVDFHLPFICDRMETPSKAVSPEFLSCLLNYPWPGNVRELVNALERSVSAAWDELTLFPLHLPAVIRIHLARTAAQAPDVAAASYGPGHVPEMSSLDETRIEAINQAEEKYLRRLLEHTGGKIEEAYRIAGLSRSRLYALLKKHHIKTGR